ncbi:transglutaminase-like domain-containing protein [Bdellovibrio bacteriovorus]|uniref:Transglutaminase-like protein n=1 Tax=Bdellovibrio bacteriovorus str. Tiberius TaxID=1069642 RepID=K7YLV0_BDEBC|nr:transglutaminase-like domain-containing protein [Bdellovibrio bacteriovorus]AFY00766.1 Transglutaminase-like protein [Bdellovibrio bacteriovorus str. Tiberius]
MKLILHSVFLMLLVQSASAQEQNTCFEKAIPFFQNFSKISVSPIAKASMLESACEELDDPRLTEKIGIFKSLGHQFMAKFGFGVYGQAIGAFDRLQGDEWQMEYAQKLQTIKSIPDPLERIRQVYLLVVRNQGSYDNDSNGMNSLKSGYIFGEYTPSNLLNTARKTGSAGVCRHFASLLQWSLIQVARHPSSRSSALGPLDFSSEFVLGTIPDAGGHAWVRVHLPQYDLSGRLQGFNNMDLDTTWYSRFSPVFPRFSGLKNDTRIKAAKQCREIQTCLRSVKTEQPE